MDKCPSCGYSKKNTFKLCFKCNQNKNNTTIKPPTILKKLSDDGYDKCACGKNKKILFKKCYDCNQNKNISFRNITTTDMDKCYCGNKKKECFDKCFDCIQIDKSIHKNNK